MHARIYVEASLFPAPHCPSLHLHLPRLCWVRLCWLAALQVMAHADTAFFQGYLDPQQRMRAMAMQLETVQLISAGMGACLPRRGACLLASWRQLCCAQLAAATCLLSSVVSAPLLLLLSPPRHTLDAAPASRCRPVGGIAQCTLAAA